MEILTRDIKTKPGECGLSQAKRQGKESFKREEGINDPLLLRQMSSAVSQEILISQKQIQIRRKEFRDTYEHCKSYSSPSPNTS